MSGDETADRQRSAYVGWWAAAMTLVVIFSAATVVWFIFHPW